MAYRSIIVTASGGEGDAGALAAAAKLASSHGARVRVIPAFPDPAANYVYYGTTLGGTPQSDVIGRVQSGEAEAQAKLEAAAREAADREGLKAEALVVEKRELAPAIALASAAVLADLVVFDSASVGQPFALGGLFAETLIAARAPILLVRAGAPFAVTGAAIAWDGSGQAGRAVRAALPYLRQAPNVVVLTNTDDLAGRTPSGAERLTEYLALHGVANVSARATGGANVAASLLEGAAAAGCGVLVSGAYGRPRLYEMALGGTTRALVNAQAGPHLLLAH